jgi:hypothetical protein
MTFEDYARRVGIVPPNGRWHIKHLRPATEVLGAAAAIARQSGETLDFGRIVNKKTGKPGSGAHGHQSRIIRCRAR